MAQKNKKEAPNKKLIAIISGICAVAVVGIIALVAVLSQSSSKPKEIRLEVAQATDVSSLVLAVALDKLDGSGSVPPAVCETFRTLAEEYNKNTDWFKHSYCSYIIYADYSETAQTKVVTLSDGAHAAIYTFDSFDDLLLDYEFVESTTKGRAITIDSTNNEPKVIDSWTVD